MKRRDSGRFGKSGSDAKGFLSYSEAYSCKDWQMTITPTLTNHPGISEQAQYLHCSSFGVKILIVSYKIRL